MSEMIGRVELVTPEQAKKWLEGSNGNRALKHRNLERIKRALQTGQFVATHQGIALDECGRMFDGHHRCQAIVDTGISANVFVVRNAPNVSFVDSGVSRSERDQLYMSGLIEKGSSEWNVLTMPLVNMILAKSYKARDIEGFSAIDKHNAYMQLQDTIDTTILCVCTGKKHRGAAVLYPMACAINAGVDPDVVRQWHRIVVTGDFYSDKPKDTLAGRSVLLFKQFAETTAIWANGDRSDAMTVSIKKAMSSIDYFSRKEAITKLYGRQVYPDIIVTI